MSKEQVRRDLLERYLSTGMIGLTKPKDDDEAIDLIEAVVNLYDDEPRCMTLSEMVDIYHQILDDL